MSKLLTIAPSPHISGKDSVKKIMFGVIIAMIPAYLVSVLYFGMGAISTAAIAILSAVVFEWLIQKFLLKGKVSIGDGSAIITGMLLAFNLPSSIPWWMVIIGTLVAIGIGKMTFGGLGNNPFNPALVGRVFMLISWPVDMTSWPKPGFLSLIPDGTSGATPLTIMKDGLKNHIPVDQIMDQFSYTDLFLGHIGGSLGEVSAVALIIGGLYLLIRKIISWHIPVSMIGSILIFTGILHVIDPTKNADPMFHLLTGGALLGAIFMATDMVTSPMTARGQLVFGLGIGVLTVLIRVFGAYPEGVSFAILIMNATVPLLNKAFKPKRFGEEVKNG